MLVFFALGSVKVLRQKFCVLVEYRLKYLPTTLDFYSTYFEFVMLSGNFDQAIRKILYLDSNNAFFSAIGKDLKMILSADHHYGCH